jgi:hypothetical protein
MIQRIVLFQFRPDVPDDEIAGCVEMLRALPAQIAAIRGYEVARNRGGRDKRYHVSLLARFDDEPALRAYEVDPAHAAFVERVRRGTSDIIVFDYDEE